MQNHHPRRCIQRCLIRIKKNALPEIGGINAHGTPPGGNTLLKGIQPLLHRSISTLALMRQR